MSNQEAMHFTYEDFWEIKGYVKMPHQKRWAEDMGLCPHSTVTEFCKIVDQFLIGEVSYERTMNKLSSLKVCNECNIRLKGGQSLSYIWYTYANAYQPQCMICLKSIDPSWEFRDHLSKIEFKISGLCQRCQDRTFVCEEV